MAALAMEGQRSEKTHAESNGALSIVDEQEGQRIATSNTLTPRLRRWDT